MRLTKAEAKKFGIHHVQPKKQQAEDKAERRRIFNELCRKHGLPPPRHEYRWHLIRRWRFDYCFEGWLAVERVGGVWIRGHHSRGQSQIDDMERRNEAQIAGYTVLEFTPQQFDDGSAFAVIRRALKEKQC